MGDLNDPNLKDSDLEVNVEHHDYECDVKVSYTGDWEFICKCGRGTKYRNHSNSCTHSYFWVFCGPYKWKF